MTKRSMQGKPVFPIMIKNVPIINGKTANWNGIIDSGVRVNPRSLNMEAGVKKPLGNVSKVELYEGHITYHQTGLTPSSLTIFE